MHDILKHLSDLNANDLRYLDADRLRRFETLCEHWAKVCEGEVARRKSLSRGRAIASTTTRH